jgi:hypothetical protein
VNAVSVSGAVRMACIFHALHGKMRIVKASVCSASRLHVDGQTLILLTAPTMIQDPLSGQETAYLRRGHGGHIPKAQSLPTEAAELHSEKMVDIRSMRC